MDYHAKHLMARQKVHEPMTTGERVADAVAKGMGSWKFIIIQTTIVAIWIALNCWILAHPYDPFPLILLNLVFSTQAAYAAPLIQMSQNRTATKDRKRDDMEAEEVASLVSMNQQQLEILNLLHQLLQQRNTITISPSIAPVPPSYITTPDIATRKTETITTPDGKMYQITYKETTNG